MLKLLKSYGALPLVVMPLSAVLWWMLAHGGYFGIDDTHPGWVYGLLVNWAKQHPHTYVVSACIVWHVLQAFYLNFVLNRHEVLFINTWIPAVIYIMIGAAFPVFLTLHPLLVVMPVYISVLEKIFKLYKNTETKALDFDTGALIGVASLVYFPSVMLLLVFMVAMLFLKPLSWRDGVIVLLGYCLPWFVGFALLFVMGVSLPSWHQLGAVWPTISLPQVMEVKISQWVTLGVITGLLVLSLLKLSANFYKNVIRTRNMQQVIFVLLFVMLLTVLMFDGVHMVRYFMLCVPVSVLISYYFVATKRIVLPESLFILLVCIILYNVMSRP